jgi:hypothetical protein
MRDPLDGACSRGSIGFSGSCLGPSLRIEDVAQAIPEQIEAEYREH